MARRYQSKGRIEYEETGGQSPSSPSPNSTVSEPEQMPRSSGGVSSGSGHIQNNIGVARVDPNEGWRSKPKKDDGQEADPTFADNSITPDMIQGVKQGTDMASTVASGGAGGVKGFAMNALSGATGGVMRMVTTIATLFRTKKTVAGALSALALVLLGGVGSYVLAGNSLNEQMTTIFVGDDECENLLAPYDEVGQNEIPESWEWWPTGKEPAAHGRVEIPLSTTLSLEWGGDSTVAEFNRYLGEMTCMAANDFLLSYINSGDFKTVNGATMVGDWYPMAINPSAFGSEAGKSAQVGDWITVYFDNDESIEIIMFDAKGSDNGSCEINGTYDFRDKNADGFHRIMYATDYAFDEVRPYAVCPWGHVVSRDNPEYINVWECLWHDGSTTKIGQLVGDADAKPVSFTNHGLLPEYASFEHIDSSSVVGGASSSMTSSRSKKAASAVEECKATRNYDNSTLAAALVSYSYSQRKVYDGSSWEGTKLYLEVFDAVYGDGYPRSCDRAVATAIKWTGADDNFIAGACDAQHTYALQHPELWQNMGTFQASGEGEIASREAQEFKCSDGSVGLQPGDVLIADGEHTMAYVGEEAITEGYESFVKGTDGDVGAPEAHSAFVSGSVNNGNNSGSGSRAPAMGLGGDATAHGYTVFRYIGDYPDKDKYADVGQMATISGVSVKGTSCDCATNEPEDDSCGERIAKKSLDITITAVNDGNAATYHQHAAAYSGDLGIYFDEGLGAYMSTTLASETTPLPSDIFPEAKKYNDFQDKLPSDCYGKGEYAVCSSWETTILYDLDIDKTFPAYSGDMVNYARSHPETYQVIQMTASRASGDDPWADQCKPGDILVLPPQGKYGHIMMYVGNELAQKYFPGTNGYMLEAGIWTGGNDGWYLAVTDAPYWNPSSSWSIIRVKCAGDEDANDIVGTLSDGPISARQRAVIESAKTTPTSGSGYCADWVSRVFANAGIGSWSGNACDLYYAYCTSSNLSDLKPGMIVAVSTYNSSGLGAIYGHVGVYIGNGMVRENIGPIVETPIETWISSDYYGGVVTPKWGWMGGVALA